MKNKKDLRIGNFVEYSGENLEITDINQDFPSINTITIDYLDYEEIYPIPLTEEWLIKFGFEKKGSFYRVKNSRFVEIIIHDEGIDVCNHSVLLSHIKYIHQLQNLYFALTNEELI